MDQNAKKVKYACYSVNLTMSVVSQLTPILFLTFRSLYGFSFSELGFLVLMNFVSQLFVDLIFTFYSHRIPLEKAVTSIPVLAAAGFFVYASAPIFPKNFIYGVLLLGTVIFSAASGLTEVLISPVIAALPSLSPEREMSKLHSVFAWGVVGVIAISTVYLFFTPDPAWFWLPLFFALLPILSWVLFAGSTLPKLPRAEKLSSPMEIFSLKGLMVFVIAMFCGGAAECTMSQWSSGYLEGALGIPKIWGDLLGVSMFSVMLGLGRTLYAKFGKRLGGILVCGSLGACGCYLAASLFSSPWVGLLACALTGFCTSMLWPGNLVLSARAFPRHGVMIYALMAAAGDLGASVGPQAVGMIADGVLSRAGFSAWAASFSLTPEQLGLKIGLFCASLFPLVGVFFYRAIGKKEKKILLKERKTS